MATSSIKQGLDELGQAKVRVLLHSALVVFTTSSYWVHAEIALELVAIISAASMLSATALYSWAKLLTRPSPPAYSRVSQRACSVVSDNLFISLVLWLGGEATAGVWGMYLWISIGYGMRFGVSWLRFNTVVSVAAFTMVYFTVPFWSNHSPFSLALLVTMVAVPFYTAWLIRELHSAVEDRERAYGERSLFLARMSHELRTPLHAIITTADLLKKRVKDSEEADLAKLISTSSTTLLNLINRVLDLSKFESGDYAISEMPMSLHQVVSESATVVLPEATKKGLALNVYLDSAIEPMVLGAPDQLKEVLINLLGNAVKFTEHGEVSISASYLSENISDVTVRFEVRDTGLGIPANKIADIMEPFVQADPSITRRHGGTGLGTAFSRELVRAMGGELSVTSPRQEGTVFSFDLTFTKQKSTLSDFARLGLSVILVAQDDTCNKLATSLEAIGAKVHTYRDCESAAKHLETSALDERISGLVIDLDKYASRIGESLALLRRSSSNRIFPIFGYGADSLRSVATNAGCISFATKPVSEIVQRRMLSEFASLASVSDDEEVVSPTAVPGRALRVLVADDDATNRKILRTILVSAGHSCVSVEDGDEALHELVTSRYDAAVIDMHMPKRDGVEVVKLYKFSSYNELAPTPIVMFTADATLAARKHAIEAGVDQFLTKPMKPAVLLQVIYTAVTGAGAADCAGHAGSTQPGKSSTVVPMVRQTADSVGDSKAMIREDHIADLLCFMSAEERIDFFSDFAEDARAYSIAFQEATYSEDMSLAQEEMHALAGAAVTVGALDLAELAKRIEKMPIDEVLRHHETLVPVLDALVEKTLSEIEDRYLNPTRLPGP